MTEYEQVGTIADKDYPVSVLIEEDHNQDQEGNPTLEHRLYLRGANRRDGVILVAEDDMDILIAMLKKAKRAMKVAKRKTGTL